MDTPSHTERVRFALRLQGILAARTLDLGLTKQIQELSEEQRHAIAEWQRTARVYELIQRVVRHGLALENLPSGIANVVRRTMFNLDLAMEQSALPTDLVLYRGIRNLQHTFGTVSPAELLQQTHRETGYLAGSIHADVAVRDFTTPRGALIVMHVPKGTPAIWVARAGHRRLEWQGEVLLQADVSFYIHNINEQSETPILFAKVMA